MNESQVPRNHRLQEVGELPRDFPPVVGARDDSAGRVILTGALASRRHEEIVLETLVELTRYPRDILTVSAHLEDDLGIDSVKRAEILASLGRRLGVPIHPTSRDLLGAELPKTVGELVALVGRLQAHMAAQQADLGVDDGSER